MSAVPQAVAPQLVHHDDAALLAVRVVSFAEVVGLVPPVEGRAVTVHDVEAALDALASAGVARRRPGAARQRITDARWLRHVLEAIDESPMPEREWRPITALLGDELVGALVGAAATSIHRYRVGERTTPDAVAARLHALALMCADLVGSYNELGVRRWFQRSRSALDGRSPSQLLAGDWSPDDPPVRAVRSLAASLLGSPAT
jgi:hypothetical protein